MMSVLAWLGGVFILVAGFVGMAYRRDITRARERVRGKAVVLPSPYGDIEYTENGSGPEVLMLHGAGGGYDQGELLAEILLGQQFHIITPSRFGYLHSTYYANATWNDQAHGYASLLDHLGIPRVAVVAWSAGGPSALNFAALFPERVTSLTLVSCAAAPEAPGSASETAERLAQVLQTIVRYDFPYWLITGLFKRPFMRLMGASEAVVASLTPQQRCMVEQIIASMNPASLRFGGAEFDHRHKLSGGRVASIRVATLILHATDDTIQPFYNAEFAAENIVGSRLLKFDKGGHFMAIIELTSIQETVQQHIMDNRLLEPDQASY